MRILYHHRTLGDGAEGIHVHEMVSAFRRSGHEVKIVGPVGEPSGQLSGKGHFWAKFKKNIPGVLYTIAEIAYNFPAYFFLKNVIRKFKPDFIYDRYITFNASVVLAAKKLNIPAILEVNAPLAYERSTQEDEQLFFQKLAFKAETLICNYAHKTVVVSTPLAEYLKSVGVKKEKLIVMPNGVNTKRFSPHPKSPILLKQINSSGQLIIGFSGVLRPWHGVDLLIDAFAKVLSQNIPALLLIVGDGPIRKDIETRLQNNSITQGKYHITGRIPYDEVPGYVNLFDIATCPKATFYASPMKLIEYMALAKPAVVPNTSNFLDVIDDGETGLVFEDNNVCSLAESIVKLATSDTIRTSIAKNARKKVEETLNWECNAKAICSMIRVR